ncbi:hypothetical protein SAMN06265373_103388 [Shimia sagamensis]|uniref:Secreted protein n=1 Tax=Shimia sagamensis TaxID=1566352 RepID=A0ABY1NV70_9RHOB|nr:hypothetical protein SAMN06265373_103388 [Shimia sagamensis]
MCLRPLLLIGSGLRWDMALSHTAKPPARSKWASSNINARFARSRTVTNRHLARQDRPAPDGDSWLFGHHLSHIFAPDQSTLEQHTLRSPWIVRDNTIHTGLNHTVHVIHFIHGPG